jgi:transposase-like protein
MINRAGTNTTKRYSNYSEEFKRKVCEEYIKGTKTKAEIKSQFGIKSSTSIILDWLRKFGYIESKISSISEFQFMAKRQQSTSKDVEKENEDLKLQLQMYKRMIEIAEKEFKISIIKKSDSK